MSNPHKGLASPGETALGKDRHRSWLTICPKLYGFNSPYRIVKSWLARKIMACGKGRFTNQSGKNHNWYSAHQR